MLKSAQNDSQLYSSLLRSMLNHMSRHGLPHQFPSDGSVFEPSTPDNVTDSVCEMEDLTPEEESAMDTGSFWIEDVFQTAIGILGVLGNLVAVAVYLAGGKKFYTVFYRLLICLLFTHTGYIILTLTSFFGRKLAW